MLDVPSRGENIHYPERLSLEECSEHALEQFDATREQLDKIGACQTSAVPPFGTSARNADDPLASGAYAPTMSPRQR